MALVILIAAGAVLGSWSLRPLRLGRGLEAWTWRLYAGLALCAVIALALGSYSLGLAQTVLAAVAVLGLGFELFLHTRRTEKTPEPTEQEPPLDTFERICVAATGAALFLALLSALAPVTSWDATVAHIALPSDYAREGRIILEPGNVYSGYPHLMHTLYAVAYYPNHEKPVTLLNWGFGLLGCLTVFFLGRRIAGRRCGLIAMAIFATAPIFMDQAGGVSIDLAFAAFSVAALAALAAWFDEDKPAWLVLCALLAGSACGIRHTGYVVCAFLAVAVLLGARHRRVANSLLFGAVALVAASPWLIRSAILVHNPVFPFLLSLFPADRIPHISISGVAVHESVAHTGGLDWKAFLRFPWDIVMRPNTYDGWSKSPGGMVLVLGVPGLFLGGKRARWLGVYSISGGALFFFFQRLARYLLPFFVPMMVVAAVAAVRIEGRLRQGVVALLVFSFAYGLVLDAAAVHFKIPVVLGWQTREEYLAERVERYAAFQFANRRLNDGGAILTVDQRSYYIDGPTYQNHWAMKAIAKRGLAAQRLWLRRNHIKYILLPVTFLEESGALAKDLMPMFAAWRSDTAHFKRLEVMAFPRVRGEGMERVEIYEFVAE